MTASSVIRELRVPCTTLTRPSCHHNVQAALAARRCCGLARFGDFFSVFAIAKTASAGVDWSRLRCQVAASSAVLIESSPGPRPPAPDLRLGSRAFPNVSTITPPRPRRRSDPAPSRGHGAKRGARLHSGARLASASTGCATGADEGELAGQQQSEASRPGNLKITGLPGTPSILFVAGQHGPLLPPTMANFNAAFQSSAVIMPVPVQRPWAQRCRPHRSNSTSRLDPLAYRRPLGHSRTSSGSHLFRETFLQSDCPATAAAAAPGTAAVAVQNPLADPVVSSSLASIGKCSPSMNRLWLAQDVRVSDMNARGASAESVSSASGGASLSARTTMTSGLDSSSSRDSPLTPRPLVQRNGRAYLSDPTLPYPLPVDLTELHRQSMRTLLLIQLFGAPVCSPYLTKHPPRRVLEIGCGSGFWSMMCHRYYKGLGHGDISFTGIDVAPLGPTSATATADSPKSDTSMRWKFCSHDIRVTPWPFSDDEQFDLIMAKDMSLAVVSLYQPSSQEIFNEYLRLLKPGGTLEIWESDHLIRLLRPHAPRSLSKGEFDEVEAASNLGAYPLSANTPLSAPVNSYILDYNTWLTRALEARRLSPVPCTLIGPALLQESDLVDVKSRRLAIPLSEVRWEREGIDGAVHEAGGEGDVPHTTEPRSLSLGQRAIRATALTTVVEQIQALEPVLRAASGKSQDEWDVWLGKMMGDLMGDHGAIWGECLEVGAWWARKKSSEGQND